MKKTLLIAALASLAMVSCKKERTCTCTMTPVSSTVNGVSQPVGTGTRTQVTKFTKVSKAGAACNSGEMTNTSTSTGGGTTYTYVNVDKADCTLD